MKELLDINHFCTSLKSYILFVKHITSMTDVICQKISRE